jgi:hypothetical protein
MTVAKDSDSDSERNRQASTSVGSVLSSYDFASGIATASSSNNILAYCHLKKIVLAFLRETNYYCTERSVRKRS